jgi:serine/threonine protein kinase/Tol biopolymer transport system component
MALTPGDRVGSYEVLDAIGAGGMGEVYRGRDRRLGRDVALKILPAAFVHDPERLARFEREAHLLASLNHPNIATIYGLEPAGDSIAIVMELVEGEDLAALIARGNAEAENASSKLRAGDSGAGRLGGVRPDTPKPSASARALRDSASVAERRGWGPAATDRSRHGLSVDEALDIARQIALALEAAHEQGIIHRDLKPSNIKVRPDGTVKVLDFGLAKALVPSAESPVVTESPTITSPAMTALGVILGTAAYMAPEQARGRAVDRRIDIWAFGCVWYEMLTGRRAFDGDDVSDTLAAVLRADPDWTLLPVGLSPALQAFLRRCLEKDPRRRVRDIGDVRLALEGAYDMPASGDVAGRQSRHAWSRPAVAASVLSSSLLVAAAVWFVRPAPAAIDARVARFEITLAPDAAFSATVLSPLAVLTDPGHILFSAAPGALRPNRLYRRALDQFETLPTADDEDAVGSIFLSPDEEWLGFVRMGTPDYSLQKMRVGGGPAVTLARLRVGGYQGASWGRGGHIAYTSDAGVSGLMLLPDAGGTPRNVTTPSDGETHLHPYFLPDGSRILFTRRRTGEVDRVAVLDLETGRHEDLVDGAWPRYAPSGHLLFARDAAMWAAAFDPVRRAIVGDPVPVLDDVGGASAFSYSQSGLLVYRSQAAEPVTTLVWVGRDGVATPLAQGAARYWLPRLSPDGRRLAVGIASDIWVIDLERGGRTRVTSGQTSQQFPFTWARDGRSVTIASPESNRILQVSADGSGTPSELLSGPHAQWPTDWAPGDRSLAFYVNAPATSRDLWTLTPGPSTTPALFLSTPFQERAARFSPDGRWLAYVSNESGRDEVYVRPYPGPGDPGLISASGGTEPVWSRSGEEVFYRLNGEVWVRPFAPAAGRPSGEARRLFTNDSLVLELGGIGGNASYDVHPDGQRLIMLSGTPTPTTVRIVQNWFEELRRLVPVP